MKARTDSNLSVQRLRHELELTDYALALLPKQDDETDSFDDGERDDYHPPRREHPAHLERV